jgi:SAM-dependent methyltransferase
VLTMVALSRTCALEDFGCLTVAAWQQLLAQTAWAMWEDAFHIRTRESVRCVNLSGVPFTAPGPDAIYEYDAHPTLSLGGVPYLQDVDRQLAAIFAVSVLDHCDAPVKFLHRAAQVLRPHGLLFLTFAFWAAEGEDLASGHQTRRRIFSVHSWERLIRDARREGFTSFGGHDWTYHGHRLGHDHSLASLVLTRR